MAREGEVRRVFYSEEVRSHSIEIDEVDGEVRRVFHSEQEIDEEIEDEWIKMMKDKIELPFNNLESWPLLYGDEKEPKISKLTLHDQEISQSRTETTEGFSQPRVVTIGPFHRQTEVNISDEEKRMFAYFVSLLYDLDLAGCIKKVKNQEENARERYSDLACEGFTEMLLLDSYFILFVLTIKIRKRPSGYTLMPVASSEYSLTKFDLLRDERTKVLDILCNKDEIVPDLLILDNQIPFFVIEKLYTELNLEKPLHEYALEFFETIHPRSTQGRKNKSSPPKFSHLLHLFHWSRVPENKNSPPKFSHLLHLFHWSRVPENKNSPPKFSHLLHLFHWFRIPENKYINFRKLRKFRKLPKQPDSIDWARHTPNAMELRESATMFEKNMSSSSLDITFRGRRFTPIIRVFDIPEVHIRDYSSIIFHNLIAFEMQSSNRGCCTMAFSTFMRNLMQSEEDVKLLRRKGILVSSSMDNNKLIYLFERLNRLTENYQMPRDLSDTLQQVRSHHESMVSRFCGNIILQYFPNPLVTLSVAAAAMIFVLTLLQTIYTMISYYHHS